MEFSSNVSLTHRSTLAVISSLWNQNDIIVDIQKILLGNLTFNYWAQIENNVLSSLEKLELPSQLKLYLKNFVQPMGMQIQKWITLTTPTFQDYPHLSKPIIFVWTEKGILDYCETAKLIIECNSDKILCFCLACIFCIEDVIFQLWSDIGDVLSEKIKAAYSVESVFLIYWTYYLNDEIEELMTLTEYCGVKNAYEFAFLLTLDRKCVSSLNYFLQQVEAERKQKLVKLALHRVFHSTSKYLCDGNLVLFLLSHLKESDIDQIKSRNCYLVLVSLLEWPCQELFMANMISSSEYLSNFDYQNLFQDILEYVSKYHAGNLYKNLIKQFWKLTPVSFKEYAINKCISGTFLSRLFLYENTDDIIQMIFSDCTSEERQFIIFHYEGMNICDLLVRKERWESLKLFIKNCIPSNDVLEEFIEYYKNYKPYYYQERTELRTEILIKKIREWY